MNTIFNPHQHISAIASHYDKESKHYDAFNEEGSRQTNQVIEKILRSQHVSSVLDMTCGTGSQVFYLTERGYQVMGIDINACMLDIAIAKARERGVSVRLELGDMRTSKVGKFDAVISIFNAVGHLTQTDFDLAIKNIYANLKDKGFYLFDIFNLDYLLDGDNITKLTIDNQRKTANVTAREIQYSTITKDGVLASYDIYHEQIGNEQPKISDAFQTLQVYSVSQLKKMLATNGFSVIEQLAIDGANFDAKKSERIFNNSSEKIRVINVYFHEKISRKSYRHLG